MRGLAAPAIECLPVVICCYFLIRDRFVVRPFCKRSGFEASLVARLVRGYALPAYEPSAVKRKARSRNQDILLGISDQPLREAWWLRPAKCAAHRMVLRLVERGLLQ